VRAICPAHRRVFFKTVNDAERSDARSRSGAELVVIQAARAQGHDGSSAWREWAAKKQRFYLPESLSWSAVKKDARQAAMRFCDQSGLFDGGGGQHLSTPPAFNALNSFGQLASASHVHGGRLYAG